MQWATTREEEADQGVQTTEEETRQMVDEGGAAAGTKETTRDETSLAHWER